MALTDFQKRKMTHLFNRYDIDGSGTIGASDYERRVEAIAEQRGLAIGSDEYKALQVRIMQEWDKMALFSDIDGDGTVSLYEFLEFADYTIADDQLWHETSEETAQFIISICDADGDGEVSLSEYRIFFAGFNLPNVDIVSSFNQLDVNGDGQISVKEFTQAFNQYGKSNNPDDAGNFMFGALDM